MTTITISIKEIAELSMKGLIAVRHSAEYGQTAAGAHCAISAERRVVIEVSPTGVGYVEGSNITIYPARGAGEGSVFLDPESGRIWWGSMTTLRLLASEHDPLKGKTLIMDRANLEYQRALLRNAG